MLQFLFCPINRILEKKLDCVPEGVIVYVSFPCCLDIVSHMVSFFIHKQQENSCNIILIPFAYGSHQIRSAFEIDINITCGV